MNVCVFVNVFQFIIGIGRLLLFGQAVQCGDANLKSILYVCLNNTLVYSNLEVMGIVLDRRPTFKGVLDE